MIEDLLDGNYDLEVVKAQVRMELRMITKLQHELQSKIARFSAPPNAILLRRIASLEAEIRRMKEDEADRDALRRAWRAGTGECIQ